MFEGHPLFGMENVYRAYRRCRRHKRGTVNALRFEAALEENLVALHEELCAGTYRPGRSVAFLVEKPKRREIFAADFRDRVVHHILVGHLEPVWERRFIHDSYACRKGKGTHAGVERLRSFLRQATANGTRPAWYLQLDVQGYFIALNREILYRRIAEREHDPAVLWLAKLLIFHEPTRDCVLRGAARQDFDGLPEHKTLFKAAPRCGLPIGNLTSQFFANVYLDALDQFVKHELGVRHYVRYCDDFVLVREGRAQLADDERRIEAFLTGALGLRLNARRKLRPVSDGIDFLGYVVRPAYVLVRRRVVGALRERLAAVDEKLRCLGMRADPLEARRVFVWDWPTLVKLQSWLHAYLAHFERASAHRLVAALRSRYAWLNEFFAWGSGCPAIRVKPQRHALRLSRQRDYFQHALSGHVLVMQIGGMWEVMPGPFQERVASWYRMALLEFRIRDRDLNQARQLLWTSNLPVGWIKETDSRVGGIAERRLACRWAAQTLDMAA